MPIVFLIITLFSQNLLAKCQLDFETLPKKLSTTCLYEDIKSKKINSDLKAFAPKYPLWSDGAEKQRWVYLPADGVINSKDVNHWGFPVGTIFWKEFSLEGKRLETRVIKKVKDTREVHTQAYPINWIFGTYLWNEQESEAFLIEWEVENARGTHHTVPSKARCYECHAIEAFPKENEAFVPYRDFRPLGFKAFQLADSSTDFANICKEYLHPSYYADSFGYTLEDLLKDSKLSHEHNWLKEKPILVGDELQRATMAYFSVNCAHCHSSGIPDLLGKLDPIFSGVAGFTMMELDIDLNAKTVNDLPAFKNLVGVKTTYYQRAIGGVYRIKPGDYKESAIWRRFTSTKYDHMPQSGSHTIDAYGKCLIEKWTESL